MEEVFLTNFVNDEYGKIVGSISAICGSRSSAEDAVQEALLRAWERTQGGDEIASLGAWVTAVALNLTRNRLRHRAVEWRNRHRLVEPEGQVAGGPSGDRIDVARALLALPRRQREAVVLHYYLGYDVSQTAETMRAPTGTVKSLLSRARSTLSSSLAEHNSTEAAKP